MSSIMGRLTKLLILIKNSGENRSTKYLEILFPAHGIVIFYNLRYDDLLKNSHAVTIGVSVNKDDGLSKRVLRDPMGMLG